MENFSYHVPVYVVDSGVATAGQSADMTAKQVGIFSRTNFSVSTGASTDKELFFAQAPNGGKDWYGNAVSGSHKSPFFLVKDVQDFYKSTPVHLQNEEYIIGYNGAVGSKGLTFEKGVPFRLQFLFTGEPTYRFFGGPKQYLVSHTPQVDCSTDCQDGTCADNVISDVIMEAKAVVDKINTHTELFKFGVKAYLTFAAAPDETAGGTATATRTLKITMKRKSDGSDRIADITADISGVAGINIGSLTKIAGAGATTLGVADEYTVTQTSYDATKSGAALSSQVTFSYAEVPAIEGIAWTEISATDPASTAAATPAAGRKVGIRVTAGYIDPKFGNCSFDPADYYETMPVKMEVSMFKESEDRCDVSSWPSILQTKIGTIARQTGEHVIREVIMKSSAYLKHINQFSLDPREREAFDQNVLTTVDRTAYYTLYYVRFTASYGNSSFRKAGVQEKFTAVFAVKEGDTTNETALVTNIINVLQTRTGITLHTNS
jgi:hypothetical protein